MRTYEYKNMRVRVREERYANNETLAVFLDDDEDCAPVACITVNLNSVAQTDKTAFVDENNNPGIGAWLQDNGIARPTGYKLISGFCIYELYTFYLEEEQCQEE